MSNSPQHVDIHQHDAKPCHIIFGYTPMCGTCKMAERMLNIANEILKLPMTKVDLNFHPQYTEAQEIQSVPVIILMAYDQEIKRIYAVGSVTDLLENLK